MEFKEIFLLGVEFFYILRFILRVLKYFWSFCGICCSNYGFGFRVLFR